MLLTPALKLLLTQLWSRPSRVPAAPRLPAWISHIARWNFDMSSPALLALVLLMVPVLSTSATLRASVSFSVYTACSPKRGRAGRRPAGVGQLRTTKGLTVVEPSCRVMAFSIHGCPSTLSTTLHVIWFLRKLPGLDLSRSITFDAADMAACDGAGPAYIKGPPAGEATRLDGDRHAPASP